MTPIISNTVIARSKATRQSIVLSSRLLRFARNDALVIFALCLLTTPAIAQQTPPASAASPVASPAPAAANPNNSAPIEISASKTVEWLRNEKKYVARENVVVVQGNMTINTDLLTADYREGAQSSMEIWQLTAEGNVQIKDENNTAYGDKGVYDVTTGIAVLTGQNLRLVSPDQTVTATERMEYHSATREAKAIGNAKVVRAQDVLTADTITAFFKDGTAAPATPVITTAATAGTTPASPLGGSGNLDRLEADGHVVIKTPTETLYGNKAIYRAATNTAELLGKVKVEKDKNVLEGERAEVNLTTNVSKMYGSEKAGGRVRGVFFPGSEKPTDKKGQGKSGVPAPFNASGAAPAAAPVKTPPTVQPVPAAPATVQSPAASTPDLFPAENTASTPPAAPAKVSP